MQAANAARLNRQPSLQGSTEMTDRGPPLVLDARESRKAVQCGHYLYVDNVGLISSSGQHAVTVLEEAKVDFEKDRLLLHEVEVSGSGGRSLGFRLDVANRRTVPTDERFGLIRQGIRCFLRRPRVAGWELEALMGHITFMALLRRETLSLFHCVYRYSRSCYHRPSKLWPSAREELEAFLGVMVMIDADWLRTWLPGVLASDSSLTGFGVSQATWSSEEVAAVGRVPEVRRWRLGATPARQHAFECAGFKVDPVSGDVVRDNFGKPVALEQELLEVLSAERWEVDQYFEEVPSHLLEGSRWKKVMADRWVFQDDILRLEARALFKAANRAAHSLPVKNCRMLLLSDNLSVVLCFARGRSRDFRLFVQIRRFASVCLARNIRFAIRWIPSEFNSSDEGSREHETAFDPKKSLVAFLGPSADVQAGMSARAAAPVCSTPCGAAPRPSCEEFCREPDFREEAGGKAAADPDDWPHGASEAQGHCAGKGEDDQGLLP